MIKFDQIQQPRFPEQIQRPNTPAFKPNPEVSFQQLLDKKLAGTGNNVKFSAHAVERLASRNIILSENDVSKLSSAVSKMQEKGGKDGLLVMGNLAFVVSVENQTVITAMDKTAAGAEKVFTNIDSAILI